MTHTMLHSRIVHPLLAKLGDSSLLVTPADIKPGMAFFQFGIERVVTQVPSTVRNAPSEGYFLPYLLYRGVFTSKPRLVRGRPSVDVARVTILDPERDQLRPSLYRSYDPRFLQFVPSPTGPEFMYDFSKVMWATAELWSMGLTPTPGGTWQEYMVTLGDDAPGCFTKDQRSVDGLKDRLREALQDMPFN